MKKRLLLLSAAIAVMACIVFSLSSCNLGNFDLGSIIPHEHTLGEWYCKTPATCTQDGTEERKCSNCDYTETRGTDALGHDNTENITPANCTKSGKKVISCSRCDFTETETLYTLGHDKVESITPAGCKTPGEKIITCTRCDFTKTETIPALGHKYNNSEKCTVCGVANPDFADNDKWWENISYEETNLIFQMTHCSNVNILSSGCERYLAGESSDEDEIDRLVDARNESAYINANVTITYRYYDDIIDNGLYQCVNTIYTEALANSDSRPDIYCNFITDMFIASLKGAFANIYSNSYEGENYFNTKVNSYMLDLMASIAPAYDKIYVIASDYFIDLIRAFYVVPVNVKLYNSIASDMIADVNDDGAIDVNDFYREVRAKDWTYTRLAQYCAKIYKEGDAGVSGTSIDDTLGFALGKDTVSASGLLYSSSVTIINKTWNSDSNQYDYAYPEKNNELFAIFDAVSNLFGSTGVMCVDFSAASEVDASSPSLGIRTRFANDKILFGGIVLLGDLESEAYQKMNEKSSGFGIAPVPLYKDSNDDYLTQIHGLGRAGAIAKKTTKFYQCSVFLQYQTENSDEIVDEYYNSNFSNSRYSNIEMIEYLKSNASTSFDKLYDEAIGFLYLKEDQHSTRWHDLLCNNDYRLNVRAYYYELYPYRDSKIAELLSLIDKIDEI